MKRFSDLIEDIMEDQGSINAIIAGSVIGLVFFGSLLFVAIVLGTFFSINPFTILVIIFIIYGLKIAFRQYKKDK